MTICVGAGETFDVTGHYPILAGVDSTGEPLYIALTDDHHRIFTCVNDGASTATFVYGNGEAVTVDCFYVLVLRYDPIDLDPNRGVEMHLTVGGADPSASDLVFWRSFWPTRDPYPPKRHEVVSSGHDKIAGTHFTLEGAMDPTGPVLWRKFWPITDPSLLDCPKLLKDKNRLGSCFNTFKRCIKDGDSYLEAEIKFKRAMASCELFGYGPRREVNYFETLFGDSAGPNEENRESSFECADNVGPGSECADDSESGSEYEPERTDGFLSESGSAKYTDGSKPSSYFTEEPECTYPVVLTNYALPRISGTSNISDIKRAQSSSADNHMHGAPNVDAEVEAPATQAGKNTTDAQEMTMEERLYRMEQEIALLREENQILRAGAGARESQCEE